MYQEGLTIEKGQGRVAMRRKELPCAFAGSDNITTRLLFRMRKKQQSLSAGSEPGSTSTEPLLPT